ncbi:hypothetical protein HWD99_06440 [Microbacterium sp. C5A9]|uniref:hypothetical protein n=1 Tax=Microbacterium sp. C5A9 TaxID=2736663 RepID=UPI001F51EFC7|nr:hypothetical protein [Microbacterium sp. C5A9]MCI1018254.1 hypothetical protein [Microbacterium sp. C5A9]
MTRVAGIASWSAAGGMLLIGATGALVTADAWSSCGGDQTTEACLRAMDQPGHLVTLQLLWLGALGLCVLALFVARGRGPRVIAGIAALLVFVMSYPTEYILWLGIAGGHWDVAPGTGYTQSLAFVLAGVLLSVSARRSADDGDRRPIPTESASASLVEMAVGSAHRAS